MSGERHPHELTCQAPRRTGPGRFARSDATCGHRLFRHFRPIQPTGRLLEEIADVGPGCMAAWCRRCQAASEYEYVDGLGTDRPIDYGDEKATSQTNGS